MLFRKTVKNYDEYLTISDNINSICEIITEKIEGKKNIINIQIEYNINDQILFNLKNKYYKKSLEDFKIFFSDFLDDNNNSINFNLFDVYIILLCYKKDDYITKWIKNYFCHDNYFLEQFKELHNIKEV